MQTGAAIGPDAMEQARAEVHAAVDSDDPTTALRATAIELAQRGLGRGEIEALFASVAEELAEAGRDEEANLVAYVLDMISEW